MDEQWPPNSGVPSRARFKKARSLKWGETPFDDLSRGELLRLVQAYHSAMLAARSVMLIQAESAPSAYWSFQGTGGRALAKANELARLVGNDKADAASEAIYRSFFRTADVLLFPYLRDDRFSDWGVNDQGEMVAPHRGQDGYRPIEWRDVLPQSASR